MRLAPSSFVNVTAAVPEIIAHEGVRQREAGREGRLLALNDVSDFAMHCACANKGEVELRRTAARMRIRNRGLFTWIPLTF